MVDWMNGGEAYAFVDEAPPPRSVSARLDVLFDMVAQNDFLDGRGRTAEGLSMVRVMSTRQRLESLFQIGELTEGQWYEAVLKSKPGMPIAWLLPARSDYSGPTIRTNLIGLRRLSTDPNTDGSQSIGSRLVEFCRIAASQASRQPPTLTSNAALASASPLKRLHLRIVDVGHASCASLHVARDPDSQILGYCDVGSPIFFHSSTAPAGLCSVEGKRIPANGFVILSHWDFDHYSMAVMRNTKGLQTLQWIAPDQAVGPNAAKLQQSLGSRLSLMSMQYHLLGRGFSLYRGKGPPGYRNGSGYAVRFDQRKDAILLPGDIGYGLIDPAARHALTGLAATHHGGIGGFSPPNGPGEAVVSYGEPNRYGHPVAAELAALAKASWSIAFTAARSGISRGDRWLTAP